MPSQTEAKTKVMPMTSSFWLTRIYQHFPKWPDLNNPLSTLIISIMTFSTIEINNLFSFTISKIFTQIYPLYSINTIVKLLWYIICGISEFINIQHILKYVASILGFRTPFNIYVHTDNAEGTSAQAETMNRGFCLDYVQQPCSVSG